MVQPGPAGSLVLWGWRSLMEQRCSDGTPDPEPQVNVLDFNPDLSAHTVISSAIVIATVQFSMQEDPRQSEVLVNLLLLLLANKPTVQPAVGWFPRVNHAACVMSCLCTLWQQHGNLILLLQDAEKLWKSPHYPPLFCICLVFISHC